MSTDNAAQQAAPSLADRLRSVRVAARKDIDVSRHVFRNEPAYVLRDPITFQSHRLTPADYRVFCALDGSRALGEVFADLVEQGLVGQADEEKFYQFVFGLHRLGLLSLPVSDDKLLYRRYQAKRRAKTRQRITGFLFMQVPLVNPDTFLSRTMPLMRWAFTRTFLIVWLLLVGSAIYIGASRWDELIQPIHGLLAVRNMVIMWLTLIGLKVIHELGHAYACKNFGGHVPEMGVYLIAFTPCAYVDATACWGFPRKLHRLIVSLAGVYFELTIAALATFVWAATDESLLNSIAYNVMFLASSVTLLFNINPLMRYDGYYVASDLLEIPNLRQRARQYVTALAKHWLLGVPMDKRPADRRLRFILASFGICSIVYRTLVMAGIATMLALKFSVAGLVLGVFFLGTLVVGLVRKLAAYLWFAEETAAVRYRAVALSVVVFLILPAVAGLLPLPTRVVAAGSVAAEQETVVRTAVPGFVERVGFEVGSAVEPGTVLAELSNSDIDQRLARARAELEAAEIRRRAYEASDPAAARQQARQATYLLAQYERVQEDHEDLRVTAPVPGRIVAGLQPTDAGRFLKAGEAICHLVAGQWEVRAILDEEQFASAQPRTGQPVVFRVNGGDETFEGHIVRINPVGTRRIEQRELTQLAGGDVIVEPTTGQATQPYFQIVIRLEDSDAGTLRHGVTGSVLLPGKPEPLATRVMRRLMRFVNRVWQG